MAKLKGLTVEQVFMSHKFSFKKRNDLNITMDNSLDSTFIEAI